MDVMEEDTGRSKQRKFLNEDPKDGRGTLQRQKQEKREIRK